MARANRHYIPGHVWHLTHHCHKREFLFKFAKDRLRWMQWLYEARKKHHLVILNYMVTSNRTHLLVYDNGSAEVIPKSVQLLAERVGQEYNIRNWHGPTPDHNRSFKIKTRNSFSKIMINIPGGLP